MRIKQFQKRLDDIIKKYIEVDDGHVPSDEEMENGVIVTLMTEITVGGKKIQIQHEVKDMAVSVNRKDKASEIIIIGNEID